MSSLDKSKIIYTPTSEELEIIKNAGLHKDPQFVSEQESLRRKPTLDQLDTIKNIGNPTQEQLDMIKNGGFEKELFVKDPQFVSDQDFFLSLQAKPKPDQLNIKPSKLLKDDEIDSSAAIQSLSKYFDPKTKNADQKVKPANYKTDLPKP